MEPFYVKDCTLVAIATGIKALTLAEFRDKLPIVPPSCFFYHFWGGRLRTSFEHHEYHSDFSNWAHKSMHDNVLAERIDLIDPTENKDMEGLRSELFEIVENRLDEKDSFYWTRIEEPFHFMQSKILIFNTPYQAKEPKDFINIIPLMSPSSIFFHFIDSVHRLENQLNDFNAWLNGYGDQYKGLIDELKKIDPFFISLSDLQVKLSSVFTTYFLEQHRE